MYELVNDKSLFFENVSCHQSWIFPIHKFTKGPRLILIFQTNRNYDETPVFCYYVSDVYSPTNDFSLNLGKRGAIASII